jgi:hypothetical protein
MQGKTKVRLSEEYWQEGDPEGVGYIESFMSQTTKETEGVDAEGEKYKHHEYKLMAVCVFGKRIFTIDSALLEVVGNEVN